MTATSFDTDVDQALLISYDFEPACEGPLEPKCGLPAEIIIYMKCGCVWLFSQPCRDHDRDCVNSTPPGYTHNCVRCGVELGKSWGEATVCEVPL